MGFLRSDFLFSASGFAVGLGSVMNVAGSYYSFNRSASPAVADARAMAADFGVVGKDLRAAMRMESEAARMQPAPEAETNGA